MEMVNDLSPYHDNIGYTVAMDERQLGRELAALRKTREKTCPICGTIFQAFAKQAYDTKLCANRASYARHAEKRRAEKREKYQRKAGEEGRV